MKNLQDKIISMNEENMCSHKDVECPYISSGLEPDCDNCSIYLEEHSDVLETSI